MFPTGNFSPLYTHQWIYICAIPNPSVRQLLRLSEVCLKNQVNIWPVTMWKLSKWLIYHGSWCWYHSVYSTDICTDSAFTSYPATYVALNSSSDSISNLSKNIQKLLLLNNNPSEKRCLLNSWKIQYLREKQKTGSQWV